jgi:hypothetical protein
VVSDPPDPAPDVRRASGRALASSDSMHVREIMMISPLIATSRRLYAIWPATATMQLPSSIRTLLE